MNYPDYLNDKTLVFIDIEATDKNNDRKMIQFSGIKVHDEQIIDEIDFLINPEQPLSSYIINLLKLDDQMLKQHPTLPELAQQILNFLRDSVIVSFGDFDYPFLVKQFENIGITITNNHFDLQRSLKSYTKRQLSLSAVHKLLIHDCDDKFIHNALYDALMLKEIFYKLKNMENNEVLEISELSHEVPRFMFPKHIIFEKSDFMNQLVHKPNDLGDQVVITNLQTKTFTYKNDDKQSNRISYIQSFTYTYQGRQYEFNNEYIKMFKNVFEQLYLEDLGEFLRKFCHHMQNNPLFINSSKVNIQILTELIYKCLNKYVNLHYVSLDYIIKKKITNLTNQEGMKFYSEWISKYPKNIQKIFKGFRIWLKSK